MSDYGRAEQRRALLEAITRERHRQIVLWSEDHFARMGPWESLAVLTEELGEIARVLNDGQGDGPVGRLVAADLKTEITQLAACCPAWLEVLP